MNIAVRFLLAGLVALSASCSGVKPPDGGEDGGTCTGPLSEVRGLWLQCPDDYDTIVAPTYGCVGPTSTITAGLAGDLLVARFNYGLSGGTCFYDGTTRRLVGALRFDDTNNFCSHTSFEIRAGTAPGGCTGPVPSGCALTRIDRQTDCRHAPPDGGPDGA
jgi:hypothetical protein